MTPGSAKARTWLTTIAILLVVALVVAAGLAFIRHRQTANRYSAMMSTVIGLYPGADVRVLGVPVGAVDTVTPQGQLVRVDFHVNTDTRVPAGAMAAVIEPSVVADRYLQLAPAYTGGPTLPQGAVIPKERTASPAEFDDLLASVQKLSTLLGPQGVNANGALSDALHTLARNLDGNGQQINTTLGNLSQAANTLSVNKDNLAGTVRNLQSFTSNLKQNDGQVRQFTEQFAQVSGYLASERQNLGETLRQLSVTLGQVATFVRDNRAEIRTNVDKLGDIIGTVNNERLAVDQILDTAPAGLDGLVNGYNASSGTLDTRINLLQSILCTVYNLPVLPAAIKTAIGPVLNTLLPGGLAGCANVPSVPLPALTADQLAGLHLPTLPGATGLASALRTLPTPAASAKAANPSAPGTSGRPLGPQPAGSRPPVSLPGLFGGGG
jgi:virulence factor Mce-like protein